MKDFEKALDGLLNFENLEQKTEAAYNDLFKLLITSSMKICTETDFAALVKQKAEAAELKYDAKMEASEEDDPYKKLREVVRFEMTREWINNSMEHDICCTEDNLNAAMSKIRGELDAVVPDSQKQVVDSIGNSLYSDFAGFFVSTCFDMIADAKIYAMHEFRPLQLNAMGKELRTYANIVKKQATQPQKSKTVTGWFKTMFVVPAFLFKKLYAIDMTALFENSQKQIDDAKHMFNILEKKGELHCGNEFEVLREFLNVLGLDGCLTVRPKVKKPILN